MNPELRKKIGQYKADKLKQDLPEYGDGGKKFAAGLAGFAKNIPMLGQVIDPLVANTDAVKDNPVAYASGDLVGGATRFATDIALDPMGAISSAPALVGKGLKVGSAVATEKGNLDTAQGLNTASTALTGLGAQAGQLTSMFGNLGENAGGNIPVEMKDGGWLDGYESTITRLPNNMASFRYENGGSLINFKGPKHEDGGIPIDNNMKVNPFNPTAEVEGDETADPKQNYIFSDTLKPMNTKRTKPMNTKKTFAEISKSIDNKYKNNEDPITVKSKERELARLAQANEEVRLAKEAKSNPLKMKNGGNLPKYFGGGFSQSFGSFAPVTMNNPTLAGNKTNPNLLPVDNPVIPTQSGMSQRRAIDFGADFDRNNPFVDKTNEKYEEDPYRQGNNLQGAAALAGGLANIGMGLIPAQKFNPITLGDNGMQHIKDVRFNNNDLLMNRNVMANTIQQGSTSNASRIANLQGLFRGTNTELGNLAVKERLANMNQGNLRAQTAFNTSQFNASATERARAMTDAAKTRKQNILATGIGQTIGSVGMYGDLINQGKTQQMQIEAMNSMGDWQWNPKTMKYEFKAKK